MPADPSPFVSTEWLAANLGAPDLVVVDASWHLPPAGRDGRAEFLERHIPGAVFFDLDGISDHSSSLPHMLPDPTTFAREVSALGIGDGLRIVVYDALGLFSAPRVWWTFKAFGASEVMLLDGGLPKWLAEERETESGPAGRLPSHFTARLDRTVVADMAQVERALSSGGAQLLDARSKERFAGTAPEPRAGLPSGHMPGAFNLPHSAVVADGRLADADTIRAAVAQTGLDLSRPVIPTCGSGVSAAILWLALERIGKRPLALYDGSWSEWASSGKPVETDAA
ncbi:3-mercaptopyruvate sulfurtransferase [Xanthobacter pseudotagetidis]|uniref:3-mercaptopyruvate sulfurtransferase n=1 Tax=Xanthobacter pseudotagetidis TaxID=3119911 RepID=UPI003728A8D0